MATGRVNNKSTQIASRVPNDVIELMEATKEEGETVGKYIVTAITNEAKRRQRKKGGEK
ncbi:hypothetical protein QTA77_003586 [Salmonella enterica]|nr:hypothetical protein [Salmonella enterica]EJC6545469.1 hypothetical protein [Salmonella enterica]ELQ2656683.1 hypothetical protein [Salmonella enterica]ELT3413945.1 hypothetical protein [Salmonella enterica]HCS9791233.1 hypothetical protein [Salmonella enterica subsp. enterica serovar Rissen]